MSIIDNILKSFKSASASGALGIDIGTSSIKIVQLARQGEKAVLVTYGEIALGPYGDLSVGQSINLPTEKIITALNDLIGEKEVGITTKVCGVAIPFKASLLSIIEVPPVPTKELAALIPNEARKYIPVPISDVALDWSIIPDEVNDDADADGKPEDPSKTGHKVLLVAIHNNIIAQYKDIVAKCSLDAKNYEIEIFSSLRAIMDSAKGPFLILDVGASTSKVFFINRGLVISSHTINHGSQEITSNIARELNISFEDAEILKRNIGAGKTLEGHDLVPSAKNIAEFIFTEANSLLFAFQKSNNINVKQVYLIGGGSALKGFKEMAQNAFKVPIVSGNPFEKIQVPAFLEEVLKNTGPEFSVAAGLALHVLETTA